MTLRLTKKSALSKTPYVTVDTPSTSLRLAFWGLITTSGICWTLALLLGSSLLSSCSGSIFSSGSSAPPPPPPPAAPAADGSAEDRGLIANPVDTGELTRDIEVIERNIVNPPVSGREVTDVNTLSIYEILAPQRMAQLTERMNPSQEADFLSKLSLNIVIGKKTSTKVGSTVRTVNFFIKNQGKNLSRDDNPNAPYASLQVLVATDKNKDKSRLFFASGYLQLRDDGTDQFIALTLNLLGKNKLGDGSRFIDYDENGEALPGYRLDGISRISIAIID